MNLSILAENYVSMQVPVGKNLYYSPIKCGSKQALEFHHESAEPKTLPYLWARL